MRTPQANDYIVTQWDATRGNRNNLGTWRGKVRRVDGGMALIEWSDCGRLPTDICTWVCFEELKVTRRPKAIFNKEQPNV